MGSSAKMEANKMGSDEFLEPDVLMVPCKAFPP
jgi:hypothetical protein